MKLTFDWDEGKARENRKVHKVSFEEAKAVFNDPCSLTMYTQPMTIGCSASGHLSRAGYCWWYTESYEADGVVVVRIISARKATSSERRVYEENED